MKCVFLGYLVFYKKLVVGGEEFTMYTKMSREEHSAEISWEAETVGRFCHTVAEQRWSV